MGNRLMNEIKTYFGKNLKKLRKIKGYSQEVLAEKIGIDRRQLTRIETGKSYPSFATLNSICDALDISPSLLFDFSDFIEKSVKNEFLTENQLIINEIKLKLNEYEHSKPKLQFIKLAIQCLDDKSAIDKIQNVLHGMLL